MTHCTCALVVKLLLCSVRSTTLLSTTCRTAGRPSGTSTLVSDSERTPAPTLLLPLPPLNQSSLTPKPPWSSDKLLFQLFFCEKLWGGHIIRSDTLKFIQVSFVHQGCVYLIKNTVKQQWKYCFHIFELFIPFSFRQDSGEMTRKYMVERGGRDRHRTSRGESNLGRREHSWAVDVQCHMICQKSFEYADLVLKKHTFLIIIIVSAENSCAAECFWENHDTFFQDSLMNKKF